jgi:hypothetical protein
MVDNPVTSPLKSLKGNKKVLLYVGGGAAVFVLWRYWQARQATPVVVPSAGDTSVAQGGGGEPMENTNVGNQVLNTPANNAQWTQEAVSLMTNQGWDPATVSIALGKYLNGQGLTDSEIIIVQAALALAGHPPIGTYGLIKVSNPTPTPTPTPTATVPGVPGGFRNLTVSRSTIVVGWNPVGGATGYEVFRLWNGKSTKVSTISATFYGLRAGTRYEYRVRAYNSKGFGPYSPTQYFVTKK